MKVTSASLTTSPSTRQAPWRADLAAGLGQFDVNREGVPRAHGLAHFTDSADMK